MPCCCDGSCSLRDCCAYCFCCECVGSEGSLGGSDDPEERGCLGICCNECFYYCPWVFHVLSACIIPCQACLKCYTGLSERCRRETKPVPRQHNHDVLVLSYVQSQSEQIECGEHKQSVYTVSPDFSRNIHDVEIQRIQPNQPVHTVRTSDTQVGRSRAEREIITKDPLQHYGYGRNKVYRHIRHHKDTTNNESEHSSDYEADSKDRADPAHPELCPAWTAHGHSKGGHLCSGHSTIFSSHCTISRYGTVSKIDIGPSAASRHDYGNSTNPKQSHGPEATNQVTDYSTNPKQSHGPKATNQVTDYSTNPKQSHGPKAKNQVTDYSTNPNTSYGPSGTHLNNGYSKFPDTELGPETTHDDSPTSQSSQGLSHQSSASASSGTESDVQDLQGQTYHPKVKVYKKQRHRQQRVGQDASNSAVVTQQPRSHEMLRARDNCESYFDEQHHMASQQHRTLYNIGGGGQKE